MLVLASYTALIFNVKSLVKHAFAFANIASYIDNSKVRFSNRLEEVLCFKSRTGSIVNDGSTGTPSYDGSTGTPANDGSTDTPAHVESTGYPIS
jgi:hypothetical protein